MIELLEHGRERCTDVGEVGDPTGGLADGSTQMDLDAERMAVQARALVACRHVRQPMRGFDAENLEDVHALGVGLADVERVVAMGGLEPPTLAL